MTSESRLTTVPLEFHQMIVRLESAHRDLALLQAGLPAESKPGDPATVDEAYRNVCQQRKWLYEWIEETLPRPRRAPERYFTRLRFL